MRIFGDWKFVLMLAATVAGVAGPFWLWRADQNAKAISIQLTSQVPLGLSEKNAIPGLQVVIEGTPIANPVLSTLLIQNSGDKPIATADFESPLEIKPTNGSTISGARISEKSPADIEPEIDWDKQTIRLKPTLLNPHDSIILSVVSSGEMPNFSARARIIGVSAIQIANPKSQSVNPLKRWLLFAAALACAVPAMAAWQRVDIFSPRKLTIALRNRTVYVIVLILAFAAMGALMGFLSTFGIESFWPMWSSSVAMFLAASIVGAKLDFVPEGNDSNPPKP